MYSGMCSLVWPVAFVCFEFIASSVGSHCFCWWTGMVRFSQSKTPRTHAHTHTSVQASRLTSSVLVLLFLHQIERHFIVRLTYFQVRQPSCPWSRKTRVLGSRAGTPPSTNTQVRSLCLSLALSADIVFFLVPKTDKSPIHLAIWDELELISTQFVQDLEYRD